MFHDSSGCKANGESRKPVPKNRRSIASVFLKSAVLGADGGRAWRARVGDGPADRQPRGLLGPLRRGGPRSHGDGDGGGCEGRRPHARSSGLTLSPISEVHAEAAITINGGCHGCWSLGKASGTIAEPPLTLASPFAAQGGFQTKGRGGFSSNGSQTSRNPHQT